MDGEVSGVGNRGRGAIDKAKPSLRRSCEVCRASKGRCCPSIQDPRQCQKCVKDGKECIFLEPLPRPKRPKTSRRRIVELEQKLDGIIAILSPDDQIIPGKEISGSFTTSQISSTFGLQPEHILFRTPTGDSFPGMPGLSSPWAHLDDLQDVISNNIISSEEAEKCLTYYRCHIQNFPFVIIPSHVSVDHLRRERPFVLLAILVMASKWNLQLQRRLETELRQTLSRRVVFNGEKSLDLLQGLLLYLAWYHYYCDPYHQQSYQLSQMLVAMAMELGITRHDRRFAFGLPGTPSGSGLDATRPKLLPETEQKRAFLGCFYLCSCLAVQSRMPSNLKHTDYLDECCQVLVESNEFPSDSLLPYMIRLQRLVEDIRCIFDYSDCQQLPELDAIRTDALVKNFTRQLSEMKECFPTKAWENHSIMASYRNLKIYINEIGIYAAPPYPQVSTSGQRANASWYYSTARTDSLINCLEATKDYMEFYNRLSPEQFYENTICEEIKMAYAVIILGKFTSGVNSPHIEPMQLRKSANLSYYMDALIARKEEIARIANGAEVAHYIWQAAPFLRRIKQWYTEQINGGYFTTLEDIGIPSCQDLSVVSALEFEPVNDQLPRCQMSSATPTTLETPVFPDDMWADMLETTG